MTVMPGLIDTHVHVLLNSMLDSDEALDRWVEGELPGLLREYLASGTTTILSMGDYFPAILEVRQRLEDGELKGPRLLAVGPILTAPDGYPARVVCSDNPWCRSAFTVEVDGQEAARAAVRELANAGVDAIKAFYDSVLGGAQLDDEVLAAIADEAQTLDLATMVHALTVEDLQKAVELGAARLAHAPFQGSIVDSQAGRILRETSISVSTTTRLNAPVFDEAGMPRTIRGREYTPLMEARLTQRLANVRQLVDDGVAVAFGTDRHLLTRADALVHEAQTLSAVLSSAEIVTALTRNAAAYLDLSDEIGTLEPGKVADILIINGDPLNDITNLNNLEVVIKSGAVVVDNR